MRPKMMSEKERKLQEKEDGVARQEKSFGDWFTSPKKEFEKEVEVDQTEKGGESKETLKASSARDVGDSSKDSEMDVESVQDSTHLSIKPDRRVARPTGWGISVSTPL
jgi:hypothetical protein